MSYDEADIDIDFNEDDDDSGSSGSGDSSLDRNPFVRRGHLVQAELAQGEKKFGDIEWGIRVTEPPPEETQAAGYSEEADLAAANGNVAEQHPFLTCQQFDGRDSLRDQRIPSVTDLLEYADTHPEAQLTLNPELRLALENAKRYQHEATLKLKPAGM